PGPEMSFTCPRRRALIPVRAKAIVWEPHTSMKAGSLPVRSLYSSASFRMRSSSFRPRTGSEHCSRISRIGDQPPGLHAGFGVLLADDRHGLPRVDDHIVPDAHLGHEDDS